jgi:hypothetical protein
VPNFEQPPQNAIFVPGAEPFERVKTLSTLNAAAAEHHNLPFAVYSPIVCHAKREPVEKQESNQ